ncbi:hypothetical protein D3C77_710160 [compost metagenome]
MAAGRIATQDDPLRCIALIQQGLIGGQGIDQRRGITVFRSKPVIDGADRHPTVFGQCAAQCAVGGRRAQQIAAAMQVQPDLTVVLRRAMPFAGNSTQLARSAGHAARR